MEPLEIIILFVVVAIAILELINKLPPASEFWAEFTGIFLSKWAIITYAITFIAWFLYFNKKRHFRKFNKELEKMREAERIDKLIVDLKELIEKDLWYMGAHDMIDHRLKLVEAREEADNNDLEELVDTIDKKIKEIDIEFPVQVKEERIKMLRDEEKELKEKIDDLKRETDEKERALEEKEEASLEELDIESNLVYLDEDLTENQKTLLKKHSYHRVSEFCVDRKQLINVLVKPAMRHSVTHTFLVWSVLQMLHRIRGITDIQTRDTREADIRFKFRRIWFAIEVETGTLLSKKYQLRAKAADLTRKYGDRWIIVASKKSLLPKYRIYGNVAARSELEKKLKKLLKFTSPSKGDVLVVPRRGKE